MNLISIKNLKKIYKMGDSSVHALDGVDFEVGDGEFVAVMGPSGSGKSTLMNLIGCLDRPTSGSYELAGEDVSQMSQNKLAQVRSKKIGFVFQTFNLLARYTALRNVGLPMIYVGEGEKNRKKKSLEVLKMVGLEERATHKPNELSGGERQRVAIARALVNDAKIILADEPTGNLDTKSGEEIMKIIDQLNKKKGKTIILVTHEDELARYADRKVNMRDGKIIKDQALK